MNQFQNFLRDRLEQGGFTTEDTLASFLPLVRETVEAHRAGMVAPLEGLDALHVEGVRIWFEQARLAAPTLNQSKVRELERPESRAVEVVAEAHRTTDVDQGDVQLVNLYIGQRGQEITHPVYLPGYVGWEHEVGHHDPISDVFSLGMILASLACGLDFNDPDDLQSFVQHRGNLFALHRGLHPVLAKAIVRMTELRRHARPQDVAAVLHALENYRDQDVDFEFELASVRGFRDKDLHGKRQIVLAKLQERLFEISRRNRLLHFQQTMHSLNLTHASVPLSFDIGSIRPEQILTWSGEFQRSVISGEPVSLNRFLQFDEAIYLPSVLDSIRTDAQRDQAEFGFSQLRLVACFLRWANLKVNPPEQYDSPLALLPVRLVKKKGVRDTYWLEPQGSDAEINPVLRYFLKQLYDVDLPESVDLTATTLDALYDFLAAKIQASEPAITVTKIDRPRIALIHERARRRLDQFRRRWRLSGRGVRSFLDLDYSYQPENFHPLGLRIFQTKIRPSITLVQQILEKRPRPRAYIMPAPDAADGQGELKTYSLKEESDGNPYQWEFDLCRVTLGNFRYRKMSLVRDYAALVEGHTSNPSFDATFSLVPRPVDSEKPEPPPLDQRFHVVSCDPTQAAAIARARTGKSYIIQGPPGTGKSQTITNLIADYVARGKRVLFVCEKRAAIDVVFHRLRQRGLDELACLIHDSQTDKKEFVVDLKQTYESALADGDGSSKETDASRSELLRSLDRELKPLRHFHDAMLATPEPAGIPMQELLERAVELRDFAPTLSPLEKEWIPQYATWRGNRPRIDKLAESLAEIQPDGVFAHHALKLLSTRLLKEERPLELVSRCAAQAASSLERVEQLLRTSGTPPEQWDTVKKATHLVEYALQVQYLTKRKLLSVLDPESDTSERFGKLARQFKTKLAALEKARAATVGWRHKLPPQETAAALEQARALAGSFLAVLKPAWWRLRGILKKCYDFQSHVIKPTWTRVLELLDQEHKAAAAVDAAAENLRDEFGFEDDAAEFVRRVDELGQITGNLPAPVAALHKSLLNSKSADTTVAAIVQVDSVLKELRHELDAFQEGYEDRPLAELRAGLDAVTESLDELPDFLHCLAELAALPPAFSRALRQIPLTLQQLEAAMIERTLEDIYRANRTVSRFTGRVRSRHVNRLDELMSDLEQANAAAVRARVRQQFLDHVRIAALPAAQLTAEQKEFKKQYNRGRRDLEHEFGKTMRYKPIRDLATGDTGLVIRDLKPVWLMSPLSVSDTLPLDVNLFDVTIFDEASQITLEEAVPTLFRAPQAIVVGDEMQLPPTNFFSAKSADEEETLHIEEGDEVLEYDLSGNSLLNHSARNLPATMLGWHYRSRSESLISFSNAAFYQGRLLTVPEEHLPKPGQAQIRDAAPEDGERNVDELLARPVSFHLMQHGVYSHRCNRTEADYIAHLVRGLLRRDSGLSIGIVAFSEAQQGEIEDALRNLAADDDEFRSRLEAEFEREHDDQFVGLLVKNLENIQGDERDVVIMSVCYGRGPDGKMRMNFGPINQSGGEKRLNVAFSRAKHHMALVSSIEYSDITNEYNDGANCLRNYLRYAASVSCGDMTTAQHVLRELTALGGDSKATRPETTHAVIIQLAAALAARGCETDSAVGQSHFRCDLAVRVPGESQYRLGILVDTPDYYRHTDLIERDLMRPKLLRAFGWTIAHVLTKDWQQDSAQVLKQLDRLLRGEAAAEEPEAEPRDEATVTESPGA